MLSADAKNELSERIWGRMLLLQRQASHNQIWLCSEPADSTCIPALCSIISSTWCSTGISCLALCRWKPQQQMSWTQQNILHRLQQKVQLYQTPNFAVLTVLTNFPSLIPMSLHLHHVALTLTFWVIGLYSCHYLIKSAEF